MKYMLLAIFVLFAAQPLQASYCDMCDGQNGQQSSMHDENMGHGMDADGDSHGQVMDCCDPGSDDSDDGCSPQSHCGANTSSLAVIGVSLADMLFISHSEQIITGFTGVLNRSGSPPFRPPIA